MVQGNFNILFRDTPVLSSPDTGAETNAVLPTFVWTFPDTGGPDSYLVLIDTSASFAGVARGGIVVENNSVDTETFTPSSDLPSDNTYYWRVAAAVSDGLQSDSTASMTLYVRKPATLDVVRIVTSPTIVTRGQGSVAGDSLIVQVVVKNTATVDSAGISKGDTLVFRRSRDGANVKDSFTVIRFFSADTIIPAGSVEDTFSYYVIIKSGADTGYDTITAYFEGSDTKFNTFVADGSDSDAGIGDSFVWRINAPATLQVMTVTTASDSVTRGQSASDSALVVFTVANTGDNSCTIAAGSAGVVFLYDGNSDSSDSYSVTASETTNPTTLAAGATGTFSFRVSVDTFAPIGKAALHGKVSCTDIRIATTSTDTRADNEDTWVAQTPAQAAVNYITSTTDTVYQGKTYSTLIVFVRNDGGARLRLDTSLITLKFTRRSDSVVDTDGFTVTTASTGPTGVNGGSGDTYTFTIQVSSQADTGADTIDASCTGVDFNRASLAVGDTDGTADLKNFVWNVEGAGILTVANVVSLPESVTRGQTGIKVGLVIRNSGQGAVQYIDTPVLRFSRTQLATSFVGETEFTRAYDTSSVAFPASLSIGSQFTCTFSVSVSDSAGTGAVYGLALCSGAITGGSDTITADSKAQMETWVVQTAAVIDIVSVTLDTSRIVNNNNDTVRIAVYVHNTGEATFIYTGDTAVFSNKTDSWTKVSSSRGNSLAGGAYDTFYQFYKTKRSTAGSVTVNQIVYGVDGNDSRTVYDSGATATASITVDTPRPFTITRVDAARQIMSKGQTAQCTVTVTVRNYSADTALLDTFSFGNLTFKLSAGSTVSDYTGTAPLKLQSAGDTTLGPGKEDTLTYTITQAGDSTGEIRLHVTLTGYDIYDATRQLTRSTLTDDTTAYDTVLLQTPASLSVVHVNTSADSVTQGQGGTDSVTVTVEVRNSGQASANIVTDTLSFFLGGASSNDSYIVIHKTGTNSSSIAGGSSDTFTYVVSVNSDALTGISVIDATCSGTDANGGRATEDTRADNPDTWVVQTAAQASVNYITSADTTVYQGKTYNTLKVVVRNAGGARLRLDTSLITLKFIRGDGQTDTDGFTVIASGGTGPTGVNGGSVDTYTFSVQLTDQADTGVDTIDAYCTGVDFNRASLSVGDTDGTADTKGFVWDVQGAGVLRVVYFSSFPDSVSRGETGIKVSFTIQNTGQGTVLNIETPVIRFTRSPKAASYAGDSEFTRVFDTPTATFPTGLAIGGIFSCTYTVSVSDSAGTGAVYALANCSGAINGGSDTIKADSITLMETWTVQTPAAIDIISVSIDKTPIVNNNNDTIRITVAVKNTGEAKFFYTGDTAVFSNSKDSWTKVSSTRGTSLAGGTYDTFYQVYKTTSDTGSVVVNQIVYGLDGNDSRTVYDSGATTPSSVTVDIPRPFIVDTIIASRQTVSESQTAQWTVAVVVKNTSTDTGLLNDFAFSNLSFKLTTGSTGTATNYLGTAPLVFQSAGTTALSPSARDTLVYTVTQTGDSTGTLRIDATLTGYDIFDTTKLLTNTTSGSDTVFDTVLVQTKATLSIIHVNAAADSVSRGQSGTDSVTVTVEVRNTGEAEAAITSDTLTFFKNTTGGTNVGDSFLAIRKSSGMPTKIVGNTSETWTYVVTVNDSAPTGTTVIDATFSGTDTNSGATTTDTRANVPDTWVVQDTAVIRVDSTTSSSLIVYQGQTGYVVRVSVRNTGEARLDLLSDSISLKFRNVTKSVDETDSFTWSVLSGNPTGVNGSRSDTYAFIVAVNAKAGTGTIAVDATATGRDGNRGTVTTTDTTAFPDTWAWDLQGAGSLDIVSVKCDTLVVSQGETGIVVAMIFRNAGDGAITSISQPTLRISQGSTDLTSQYTATLTSSDTTYPISSFVVGASTTCTYTVTVSSSATIGDVDINASMSGTTSGGAVTTSDTSATTPDSWSVQKKASIGIASLTITEDTFIQQDGTGTGVLTDTFFVTVQYRNNGQAIATLTVDTADLVFKNVSGKDVSAAFYVVLKSKPDTLAGFDTQTAVYLATVPDTKTDSTVGVITAYIAANRPKAIDVNNKSDVSDASAASVTDSFTLYLQPDVTQTFTLTTSAGADVVVEAEIPANKFPAGTVFTVVVNPTTPAITTGNTAIADDFRLKAPASLASSIVQISASKPSTSATKDIAVTLLYDPTDVDASDISKLRAFKLNETTQVWGLVDDESKQTVDAAAKKVTAMTNGFSFFRVLVFTPVSPNLSTVVVYPNPFVPDDGNTRNGVEFTGAVGTGITFGNLTQSAEIRIYTLGGELVDEILSQNAGRAQWDAKNSRGQKLASGLYIYTIESEGAEKISGKLAIIR